MIMTGQIVAVEHDRGARSTNFNAWRVSALLLDTGSTIEWTQEGAPLPGSWVTVTIEVKD